MLTYKRRHVSNANELKAEELRVSRVAAVHAALGQLGALVQLRLHHLYVVTQPAAAPWTVRRRCTHMSEALKGREHSAPAIVEQLVDSRYREH